KRSSLRRTVSVVWSSASRAERATDGGANQSRATASADGQLSVRLVAEHAGKAHSCQVDRLEAAVHDELGNGPTDRRGVHQAVTGEAGGDVVVVEPVVPAVEDHVPVQPVLVVQSGPGGYQSQLVGDWD